MSKNMKMVLSLLSLFICASAFSEDCAENTLSNGDTLTVGEDIVFPLTGVRNRSGFPQTFLYSGEILAINNEAQTATIQDTSVPSSRLQVDIELDEILREVECARDQDRVYYKGQVVSMRHPRGPGPRRLMRIVKLFEKGTARLVPAGWMYDTNFTYRSIRSLRLE